MSDEDYCELCDLPKSTCIHGNPPAIWAPWLAGPLRHRTIDCGHHQAEEAPRPVAEAMLDFLSES